MSMLFLLSSVIWPLVWWLQSSYNLDKSHEKTWEVLELAEDLVKQNQRLKSELVEKVSELELCTKSQGLRSLSNFLNEKKAKMAQNTKTEREVKGNWFRQYYLGELPDWVYFTGMAIGVLGMVLSFFL